MTGMKRTTEKNLMVFSGRAHPELAEGVVRPDRWVDTVLPCPQDRLRR